MYPVLVRKVLGVVTVGSLLMVAFAQEAANFDWFTEKTVVIDLDKVLEQHANYESLSLLQERVANLRSELDTLSLKERQNLVLNSNKELKKEMEEAYKKLTEERAKIEKELEETSAQLQRQMEAELDAFQNNARAKLQGAAGAGLSLNETVQQEMAGYVESVSLVRQQKLTAFRLQEENKVMKEAQVYQDKMQSEISVLEQELASVDQEERLNLRLVLENSPDQEKRNQALERLKELDQKLNEAVSERRKELQVGYEDLTARLQSRMDSNIAAFQKKLDTEVVANLNEEGQEVAGGGGDIHVEVAQLEGQFQAVVASKQAEITRVMEEKIKAAESRYEKERIAIEEHLASLQRQMSDKMDAISEQEDQDYKSAELLSLEQEYDEAVEQEEQMREGMLEDVRKVVKELSDNEGFDSVLASSEWYCKLEDKTDIVMVKLSQIR